MQSTLSQISAADHALPLITGALARAAIVNTDIGPQRQTLYTRTATLMTRDMMSDTHQWPASSVTAGVARRITRHHHNDVPIAAALRTVHELLLQHHPRRR